MAIFRLMASKFRMVIVNMISHFGKHLVIYLPCNNSFIDWGSLTQMWLGASGQLVDQSESSKSAIE